MAKTVSTLIPANRTETVDSTSQRDQSDRLIPPREAAARFGVSPRSLRRWHSQGLIRAKRTVGGHRRYRESDVSALLSELEAVA